MFALADTGCEKKVRFVKKPLLNQPSTQCPKPLKPLLSKASPMTALLFSFSAPSHSTSHSLKTIVNSPLKHSVTTCTAAANTAKPALLATCNITLVLNCDTSLSPFPLIHSQSFDLPAAAARRKKAIVPNSA